MCVSMQLVYILFIALCCNHSSMVVFFGFLVVVFFCMNAGIQE